ncbi:MAG: nucleotidyltransferase substrate binding protein [Sulfurospirillaceae bacterium]|nr:nucleotidyltransferase substrate binding protein [Sulfurospirillaceae bacterium]MDD3463021.1 nucleotidyltransferase substrate binding protein [Sulfurospirillaceae bacterium]
MQEDIRYKQRFENFEKSFLLFKNALDIETPSIVEKAGVIQFFETTFELAWKLMKEK